VFNRGKGFYNVFLQIFYLKKKGKGGPGAGGGGGGLSRQIKKWLICGQRIDKLYYDILNYKQEWQGGLRLLIIVTLGVAMETRQMVYCR